MTIKDHPNGSLHYPNSIYLYTLSPLTPDQVWSPNDVHSNKYNLKHVYVYL